MKKFFVTTIAIAMALLVMAAVDARPAGDTYRNVQSTYSAMNRLMAENPGLITKESIGKDASGSNIYIYKIGKNTNWQFMFDGRMHGPEDCGTETGIKFVEWVVNSNDADARSIRSSSQLLFIPVLNDAPTRQNSKRTASTPRGVDLNRNFPVQWSNAGSPNKYDSQNYRGNYAASEPETRALLNALSKYRPNVYLNAHCGMEGLWAVNKDSTTNKLLSNIKSISSRKGAQTVSKYRPATGALGSKGGYATLTAARNYGASSWLFEISKWENLPSTLSGYHNKWYKHAFPVYLGLAKPAYGSTVKTTNTAKKSTAKKSAMASSSSKKTVLDLAKWPKLSVKNTALKSGKLNFKENSIARHQASKAWTAKATVEAKVTFWDKRHSYLVYSPGNYLLQLRPATKGSKSVIQGGVFHGGKWVPMVESDFSPALNREYSIRFVIDNKKASLYVDGKLQESKTGKKTFTGRDISRTILGNKESLDRDFIGVLRSVKVSA